MLSLFSSNGLPSLLCIQNTEVAYLRQFYRGLNDVKNEYYDALIITGAPVEKMPFEEVSYWNELCEIVDWSLSHCFRRLSVCWGAQALLKHFYNIPKHNYKKKKFGVFNHKLPIYPGRILQGFTENFPMPVSRYTFTKAEDLQKERLKILKSCNCKEYESLKQIIAGTKK